MLRITMLSLVVVKVFTLLSFIMLKVAMLSDIVVMLTMYMLKVTFRSVVAPIMLAFYEHSSLMQVGEIESKKFYNICP
jgi:hypothetical protein